jgi:Cu/Ag efflux protein CusF
MRKYLAAALVASLSLTGSAVAFAAQAKAKPAATKPAAEKSASGTVKSIDATTLVVKTKGGDKKFTLDPAAKKDGVSAGSHVMVHYKMDGKSMVATGVMIEAAPVKK